MIHRELWKKLKFNHTNRFYIHNLESVQVNETYKVLWDFALQSDFLISASLLKLVILNEKNRTCRIVDFVVPADYSVKIKERENGDRYVDLHRELKKSKQLWNMKVTMIPILIGALGIILKGRLKGTGWLGNKKHLHSSIVKLDQNYQKCSENLWRFAIAQTAMISHQLMLVF